MSVKIIGGEWRGRKLAVVDKPGLRPTANRIRETLFNWLAWQLPGARCLDLFAGSGILGIEAVSRGAASALLVEKDSAVVKKIKEQIHVLQTTQITVYQADALYFLKQFQFTAFDIVFLDPPYYQGLLAPICELLEQKNWLNPHALIYVEFEKSFSFSPLPAWQIIRQQTASTVNYCLLQQKEHKETMM